jgi:hypothetical protein
MGTTAHGYVEGEKKQDSASQPMREGLKRKTGMKRRRKCK